jgi:hypothetical protein
VQGHKPVKVQRSKRSGQRGKGMPVLIMLLKPDCVRIITGPGHAIELGHDGSIREFTQTGVNVLRAA